MRHVLFCSVLRRFVSPFQLHRRATTPLPSGYERAHHVESKCVRLLLRYNQCPIAVPFATRGWISVLDHTGKEGLTRNGNLKVDQNGMLTNASGHLVLGENDAPITLPIPLSKIEIGRDGTISVLPQGAPAEEFQAVDRIKLVKPNDQSLFKDTNGLFRHKTPNQPYEADATVSLQTGAIEGSNVNAVGEMTALIDLQRQFEMQVKMMSTAEEMDKSSDSLLRMS